CASGDSGYPSNLFDYW
nr:immunoglobulin heavy chain junction region [Macaca mulatta]MOW75976.1 immunoglobulin heavy chain junction region [Macaca mulatta]MOW76301.1 immunoglobulin heavy chain junction region [Macaca mulatta]MOW76428.1 immunoglobulin heavy chain junction region [Macaca mulatta]MOW76666.1 immunoglobulin heavy chain junction region [Macaca mulatta]